jgi:hypothetical protein
MCICITAARAKTAATACSGVRKKTVRSRRQATSCTIDVTVCCKNGDKGTSTMQQIVQQEWKIASKHA